MKALRLVALTFVILAGTAFASAAQDRRATFERVNTVALSAFPPGTTSYEMYWLDGRDHAASTSTLVQLIVAAKKQRARWVVASDDAEALKAALLAALQSTSKSRRVLTQIVVVSPLPSDRDLIAAAGQAGVSLEFLALPPESGT